MTATILRPRRRTYAATLPFRLGCVFLALLPVPGLVEGPGGLTVAVTVMLLALPAWFAAAATREALIFDPTAAAGAAVIAVCLGGLLLWAVLSALGSDAPLESGRVIVTLLAGFSVFLLVSGTVTRARIDGYLGVAGAALAATCVLSLVAFFEPNLRGIVFMGTDRASGFFKNPNQFGIAISTVLPIALACALGRPGRRLFWTACVAALLLGLVMSGSKTNMLISAGTFAFVLCANALVRFSGPRRVLMLGLSLAAAGGLLGFGVLLLSIFNPRALRLLGFLFGQDGELHSIASRQEIWANSLEQFRLDPIFGQGAGHPIWDGQKEVAHSHNLLLDYLRSMGAPGLMWLLVLLGTVFALSASSARLALRSATADPGDRLLVLALAVAPLAYVAANFSSDSMGPSTSPFFWTVLFLGLAARGLLRRQVARDRSQV